jgi:hypothetical protein
MSCATSHAAQEPIAIDMPEQMLAAATNTSDNDSVPPAPACAGGDKGSRANIITTTSHTPQEGAVAIDVPEPTPSAKVFDDVAPDAAVEAPPDTTVDDDDEAIMQALYAVAAKEPPESESSAHVFGFESSVVEDCYDVTHMPTRRVGCWVLWGLLVFTSVARIAVMAGAEGKSSSTNFDEWLVVTFCLGLPVILLPVLLLYSQHKNTKRHVLGHVAYATALISFIAFFAENLSVLLSSMGHISSGQAPWENTIHVGYFCGSTTVMGPLCLSLLLRVRFSWVATMTAASGIVVIAVTSEHTSILMIVTVITVTSAIIGMLYATEASARWRFIAQIHIARLQAALDIKTMKAEHAARNQESDSEGIPNFHAPNPS